MPRIVQFQERSATANRVGALLFILRLYPLMEVEGSCTTCKTNFLQDLQDFGCKIFKAPLIPPHRAVRRAVRSTVVCLSPPSPRNAKQIEKPRVIRVKFATQKMEELLNIFEQEFLAMENDLDAIGIMFAEAGARVMGIMEDGDYGENDGGAWEVIPVDVDAYRRLGDPAFKLHFRMQKATYELLLPTLATHLVERGRVQRVRTGLAIPLLMVLWILATPDSFRSVALRFGVTPGILHFHYKYLIESLRELAAVYIKWPTEAEREEIKGAFEAYSGFPGIVGCIDGTHCVITAPIRQARVYRNRHHNYSFNAMAVCDHQLLVRDLHVGEVGSMHDQRVLRRTPLYDKLLNNEGDEFFHLDEHIIGDSAYTLLDTFMVPFRNNGNLTEEQMDFNYGLSRCRARIEHLFGKVFGQWRRIKMLHSLNIEYAVDHIVSCFVIHNFMILNEENPVDLEDADFDGVYHDPDNDNIDEDDDGDDAPLNRRELEAKLRGTEKRLHIMYNL